VLTVADPWVKAADNGMTAAFGTLVNNTDAEIAVSVPPPPSKVHEVVAGGGA
jgi:copper(I)-binding protein